MPPERPPHPLRQALLGSANFGHRGPGFVDFGHGLLLVSTAEGVCYRSSLSMMESE
jgi:hypothetical protein